MRWLRQPLSPIPGLVIRGARSTGRLVLGSVHAPQPEAHDLRTQNHIGLNIPLHEARAMGEEYDLPPLITLKEAALIARRSPHTIKRLVSEGRFPKSAKPGKPLLFHRDRFIQEVMKV